MVGFCDAHCDDGVEKATDLSDDPFQLLGVRVGEISLLGCRLNQVDWQGDLDQPPFPIWVTID